MTAQKDSNGDNVYTLTLATDGNGKPTKQVSIVSVPVKTGSTAANTSSPAAALVSAMQAQGFNATQAATGTLSISVTGSMRAPGPAGPALQMRA
ncbi:MAG: hypothetical protein WDN49_20780 [Acetobacteraceae bacterium]